MIEELTDVLTDPAHLIAEFIFEFGFLLASIIYVKVKLRNRDVQHGHMTAEVYENVDCPWCGYEIDDDQLTEWRESSLFPSYKALLHERCATEYDNSHEEEE